MKPSNILLAGSLAANAALVAILILRSPDETDRPVRMTGMDGGAAATAGSGSGNSSLSELGVPTASEAQRDLGAATPPSVADVAAFFSGSPEEVIARMRAAGFSTGLIRSYALMLTQEEFAERLSAQSGDAEIPPFWSAEGSTRSLGTSPEIRALNLDLTHRMRELMGADYYPTDDPNYMRRFGDLPSDKIAGILDIQVKYSEQMSAALVGGIMLPEDRERRIQLQQEQRAAIEALLTPEELAVYDLHASSTASSLRSRLVGFDATEEEFKALYALQKQFDDKYSSLNVVMTPELAQARSAAQQQLTEQFRSVLTPERFADYELVTTTNFQLVDQLVNRLELPQSTTRTLMELQKGFQDRANAVRQDRNLNPAARNEQLAALAGEAETRLSETIGERGLEVYKTNRTGTWLTNMRPRTPPAAVRTTPAP